MIEKPLYEQAFNILSKAIPPVERREDSVQRALLHHSAYVFYVYQNEEGPAAVLAAWEFPGLRYIEHFAVGESLRGQGLGAKLLQAYLAQNGLPVVLEVEPKSKDETAARRIGFYERCGLHLNEYEYSQPPLRKGTPWVPLQVMSWPTGLSKQTFEEVCLLLYREVYALSSHSLAEIELKKRKTP